MNVRKALLAAAAALAVSLASCGTVCRLSKDAFVTVTSPGLILYGATTDAYSSSVSVRDGLEAGPVVQVVSFPFTFLYHGFKHFIYCAIHLIDLPLCGIYGMAEVHPSGPEVQPLDFYQGTWPDQWYANHKGRKGTDPESGETLPPGYQR